jgi:hypothetical protein
VLELDPGTGDSLPFLVEEGVELVQGVPDGLELRSEAFPTGNLAREGKMIPQFPNSVSRSVPNVGRGRDGGKGEEALPALAPHPPASGTLGVPYRPILPFRRPLDDLHPLAPLPLDALTRVADFLEALA